MRTLPLAAAAAVVLALTGCASAVTLPPAEDASDPGCAGVIVSLGQAIGDGSLTEPLERRDTTGQGTAAFGTPSAAARARPASRSGVADRARSRSCRPASTIVAVIGAM